MGHFPLNSNAVVVVIDLKCRQKCDHFQITMENVHSQRKRCKSWLETLVDFRLSRESRCIHLCKPFLGPFFGKCFSNILDLCQTPHPAGLTKMGSAYK